MSEPLRVGFCGLGRMGTEMVRLLAERGFELTVWNRSPGPAEALADVPGVAVAATAAEAARGAEVLITMLTDGDAVHEVLTGPDGALTSLPSGSVVIDCSTTGAAAAQAAAAQCAEEGVGFLDCPVSGSTAVARQGRLGLMVGGDGAVLAQARPVLDELGTVVHIGSTGAGAAAKVALNALLHSFNTALSECVVTARRAGVPTEAFFEVLAASVLWNRFLDYKRAAFVDPRSVPVAFDLRTATKDLRLAVAAGDEAGMVASLVRGAFDIHQRAVDDGYGDADMASLAGWFADQAGITGELTAAGPDSLGPAPERN